MPALVAEIQELAFSIRYLCLFTDIAAKKREDYLCLKKAIASIIFKIIIDNVIGYKICVKYFTSF